MWRVILALLLGFCLFVTPVTAGEAQFPTEAQLQEGEKIAQMALEAAERGDFATAETLWTDLIARFPSNPAVWSNRGNTRVSQNKIEAAIEDYNKAIQLAPDAPTPYLNRGVAYEALGKYEEAIADYQRVLELSPEDAMAYNNLGNANAGLGRWEEALKYYQKATEIAPNFAFASANESLTLYQLGRREEAERKMRNLLRKYPMFPDVRAALTALLWEEGKQGEAESNWVATVGVDSRYKDVQWVKQVRKWPPKMVVALENFLNMETK